MVIDFHTHVFPPEFIKNRSRYAEKDPVFREMYADPKARMITAEDLVAAMDEQGVDKSVALNIAWNDAELCRESNDYILDSIARYPDRLIGFIMVRLDDPDTALQEIDRGIHRGARGIGEIRPAPELLRDIDKIRPVIRKLIDSRLILLTHCSEPAGHRYAGKGNLTPEVLYPFIAAFPELKLVCAHWGGGLPFYALMPEVNKALANVYFDSAASPYLYQAGIYSQVAQLVGPQKILFGTDYPLLKPRRFLTEIDSLNLAPETKALILQGNARKLLET